MKEEILKKLSNIDWSGINAEYFTHSFYNAFPQLIKNCINYKDKLLGKTSENTRSQNNVDIGLKSDFEYKVTEQIIIKKILSNVKESRNWAKEISFKDLIHSKDTRKIFVPLDFYLTPRRTHFEVNNEPKVSLSEVDFAEKNIVVLGGPGAGKTTLMKKIFIDEVDKDVKYKLFLTPFVIQFRYIEHEKGEFTIYELLYEYFGIDINIHLDIYNIISRYEKLLGESDKDEDDYETQYDDEIEIYSKTITSEADSIDYDDILDKYKTAKSIYELQVSSFNQFKEQLITEFIDNLNLLLIFDGFDELPSNTVKASLIKSIEKLSLNLNNTKFVLTSRTGEFDIQIPNCQTYEIADLNGSQIAQFINNWFDNEQKSNKMLVELDKSPYKDTALRPLNLAHLCALFERNGEIPRKPKTVYRKIVNLLIEEWDEQRNIKRASKFSQFTLDRKFDFLCNLSYYLTAKLVKVFFTHRMLKDCYSDLCEKFQLPSKEVDVVVNEIESFTGLFVKSGYDRFEFSHKSIQEYLAAEFLVKTNLTLVRKQFLLEMPNELAIAISLASNPSLYLATVLFELSHHAAISSFLFPLFQRIILEKPDFEITYFLPLSLIYLYDKIKQHNRDNVEEAIEVIFNCAPKEVMQKSFYKLKELYWKIEQVESGQKIARIVGNSLVQFDLEELKVPEPYNAYIELDSFVEKQYSSR